MGDPLWSDERLAALIDEHSLSFAVASVLIQMRDDCGERIAELESEAERRSEWNRQLSLEVGILRGQRAALIQAAEAMLEWHESAEYMWSDFTREARIKNVREKLRAVLDTVREVKDD